MGHRNLSNMLPFEVDLGQNERPAIPGQSYIHMGRSLAPDTGSFVYPSENVQTSGLHTSSLRDFESRPIEHSSSFRIGGPSGPASVSGPACGSNPYFHAARSFHPAAENNVNHSHSSHGYRNGIHEVERGLPDHAVGTGRGSVKRKRSNFTMTFERSSANRFYSTGNPSSSSADFQLEKRTDDYQNYPSSSNGLQQNRVDSISIHNVPPRNVRTRSRLDMEPDPRRTYFPSYSSHHHCPSANPLNHSGTLVNPNAVTYDQNHLSASSTVRGALHISGNTGFRHGTQQHLVRRNTEVVNRCIPEYISTSDTVSAPPYPQRLRTQSARGGGAFYYHTDVPSYRAGLSSTYLRQEATTAENSLQLPAENNSSRYPRSMTLRSWRNNRREIGPWITVGRYQPVSNAAQEHNGMESEELRMFDHSLLYGSRNLFDQHGDMRIDIDSMSYEELLDLGERIGNVSTGLSKDEISKCLIETIYPPKVENPEDETCAICLEEYKGWERIGTVKKCGHNYHAVCIEKWLLMKNVCPICKAAARADCSKEDQ